MRKIFSVSLFVFLFGICFVLQGKETPPELRKHERSVFSQSGEDGIIEKVFEVLGSATKYYVEFGAMDGHAYSNTKYLREYKGWTGLLLDSDFENPLINLHKHHITA